MDNKVFEKKIKPILTYIGAIGAVLTSIAYIVLMFVLIRGFKYQQSTQTIVFAVINAVVGLIIANFLKYQGMSFAKELPENKEVLDEYYSLHTKDKKNRSIKFYWAVSLTKDILVKGLGVAGSTLGLIYIVIVASNDWNLLLLAVVNLVLFICFGLLSLNGAYDFYNTSYIAYMRDRINEAKIKTEMEKDMEVVKEECTDKGHDSMDDVVRTDILESVHSDGTSSANS